MKLKSISPHPSLRDTFSPKEKGSEEEIGFNPLSLGRGCPKGG